jgi:hypothetical protein
LSSGKGVKLRRSCTSNRRNECTFWFNAEVPVGKRLSTASRTAPTSKHWDNHAKGTGANPRAKEYKYLSVVRGLSDTTINASAIEAGAAAAAAAAEKEDDDDADDADEVTGDGRYDNTLAPARDKIRCKSDTVTEGPRSVVKSAWSCCCQAAVGRQVTEEDATAATDDDDTCLRVPVESPLADAVVRNPVNKNDLLCKQRAHAKTINRQCHELTKRATKSHQRRTSQSRVAAVLQAAKKWEEMKRYLHEQSI